MSNATQESLIVEQLQQQPTRKPGNRVKARADEVVDHLSQAETQLNDAAAALRDFASSHPDHAERESCLGALKNIDAAADLFKTATTCANNDWNVL